MNDMRPCNVKEIIINNEVDQYFEKIKEDPICKKKNEDIIMLEKELRKILSAEQLLIFNKYEALVCDYEAYIIKIIFEQQYKNSGQVFDFPPIKKQ